MPLGNQPKTLHGYIFEIYSNSSDKLRLFSTLTLTTPPWPKLLSFPGSILISLPEKEQNVLHGILSLNFIGQ